LFGLLIHHGTPLEVAQRFITTMEQVKEQARNDTNKSSSME